MTGIAVLASVTAALAVLAVGRTSRPRRLLAVLPRDTVDGVPAPQEQRSPLRIVVAGVVLIASIGIVGGIAGVALGLVIAGLVAGAPVRHRKVGVAADDVPIVVDLVAGCLDAGALLPDALAAASQATTGLLAVRCQQVARSLQAGLTGADAWRPWLDDPSLAGVARTATRTSHTGAAAAEDFRRTASRMRSRRRAAAEHRVRQAAVWLVVPLGLCFLPAFVLVAVLPIVIGLFPSLHL